MIYTVINDVLEVQIERNGESIVVREIRNQEITVEQQVEEIIAAN
ncbi:MULTISPECIES: hypothetical protein [Vibrio]|nr:MULTISPECIES: hypothetical protein [unclassified Vibrio]MDW1590220.1 hypothetical protein [Vibrio sp. Vb2944]MDW1609282.1 hypothetical protein [Vibrio sp. Vb2908]MDW1723857.1 hypothetical protein [Vibrio sp. Vb2909]